MRADARAACSRASTPRSSTVAASTTTTCATTCPATRCATSTGRRRPGTPSPLVKRYVATPQAEPHARRRHRSRHGGHDPQRRAEVGGRDRAGRPRRLPRPAARRPRRARARHGQLDRRPRPARHRGAPRAAAARHRRRHRPRRRPEQPRDAAALDRRATSAAASCSLVVADDKELDPALDELLRRLHVQHEILWVTVEDADPTAIDGDRTAYDVADTYTAADAGAARPAGARGVRRLGRGPRAAHDRAARPPRHQPRPPRVVRRGRRRRSSPCSRGSAVPAADAPPPGFYAPDPYAAPVAVDRRRRPRARGRLVRLGVVVDAGEEGRRAAPRHPGPADAGCGPTTRARSTSCSTARPRGEISQRRAHQQLSVLVRHFVQEVSGIHAPTMTLTELNATGSRLTPVSRSSARSTRVSSARARPRPSPAPARSPSRWWRDGADRPRPQVARASSASGRCSSRRCSTYAVYRLMSRRQARASAAVANSTRAHRAAGVPPGAAPAPDPDGGARRRAPCSSAGRRSSARPARSTRRSTSRRPAAATSCCASTSPARWRPTTRRSCRPSRRSSRASRASASVSSSSTRSAATVFPLTDDYDFINGELDSAGRALSGRPGVRLVLRRHLQRAGHLAHRRRARDVRLELRQGRPPARRARSSSPPTTTSPGGRSSTSTRRASWPRPRACASTGSTPRRTAPTEEAVRDARHRQPAPAGSYFAMSDQAAIKGIVDAVQAQEATLIDAASRVALLRQPDAADRARRDRARRRHRREPEVVVVTLLPVAPWPVLLVLAVGALAAVWWNPSSRSVPGESRATHWRLTARRSCSSGSPRCARPLPGEQVDTTAANLNVYFVVDTTSSIIAEDYGDGRPRIEGVSVRHLRDRGGAAGRPLLRRDVRPGGAGAAAADDRHDGARRGGRDPAARSPTRSRGARRSPRPTTGSRRCSSRPTRAPPSAGASSSTSATASRPRRSRRRPFDIDKRLINGGRRARLRHDARAVG